MYNFIWNIYKDINPKDSSPIYRAVFNAAESSGIFSDIWPKVQTFNYEGIEALNEDEEKEWVENELIEISSSFIEHIYHYNRLIDNTDINFNYIDENK